MSIPEQRTVISSLENIPTIELGLKNPNIFIRPDQDALRILVGLTIKTVKIGNVYPNRQDTSGIANNIILPNLPDVSVLSDQSIVLSFKRDTLGHLSNTSVIAPAQDSLTFLGIDYDASTIPPNHDPTKPQLYPRNACFQFEGFYLKIKSEDGMPILEMQSIASGLRNRTSENTQLNSRRGINPCR